jgi:hypothetical protein
MFYLSIFLSFFVIVKSTNIVNIANFVHNFPKSKPHGTSNFFHLRKDELKSNQEYGKQISHSNSQRLYLFDLGAPEIAISIIVALVLFGPENLKVSDNCRVSWLI